MPRKAVRDSESSSIFYADCWARHRRKLRVTLTRIEWHRYNAAREAEAVRQSLNRKTTPIAPFHLGVSDARPRY